MTEFIARGALDEEAVRRRLEEQLRLADEHGIQYWILFERERGVDVGCCGLRPRDPERRVFELGFHVLANQWGKGFATEAARVVIAHAFHALDAEALFAGHHPRNSASQRTLERLGFRHTHDEHYPPTGLDHPSYLLPRAPVE